MIAQACFTQTLISPARSVPTTSSDGPITVGDNGYVELRHLEYFLAVADHRSFTEAAKRLHVVQSGVSATIKALERELGAELFARGPAGVDVDPRGRAATTPRPRYPRCRPRSQRRRHRHRRFRPRHRYGGDFGVDRCHRPANAAGRPAYPASRSAGRICVPPALDQQGCFGNSATAISTLRFSFSPARRRPT